MVERSTRAVSATWTRVPQTMRLYQEELLISHMQSGHKRTHSGLSSSPMSSMTQVLSLLPLSYSRGKYISLINTKVLPHKNTQQRKKNTQQEKGSDVRPHQKGKPF